MTKKRSNLPAVLSSPASSSEPPRSGSGLMAKLRGLLGAYQSGKGAPDLTPEDVRRIFDMRPPWPDTPQDDQDGARELPSPVDKPRLGKPPR